MEEGYNASAWRDRLTPELQTAEQCLMLKVKAVGGRYTLNASYRTEWYQLHLREVWDKHEELKNTKDPSCNDLRNTVITEKRKHTLRFQPAGKEPRHVWGQAIDIAWKPEKTGIAEETLLNLADACNLYRRVARDKVHFELKPAPAN